MSDDGGDYVSNSITNYQDILTEPNKHKATYKNPPLGFCMNPFCNEGTNTFCIKGTYYKFTNGVKEKSKIECEKCGYALFWSNRYTDCGKTPKAKRAYKPRVR